MTRFAVGLDFGAESVRAVVVHVRDGEIAGEAERAYGQGASGDGLPRAEHWLESGTAACREAVRAIRASPKHTAAGEQVVGIGVASAGCRMLPCRANGTPLARPESAQHPAAAEADRMTCAARDRNEPWLARCGGAINPRSCFPQILRALTTAPELDEAADFWIEAGDWLVWQLVGGRFPRCHAASLVRSTCTAGFRGMWRRDEGYPPSNYFRAVDPRMAGVASCMAGRHIGPGRMAGGLTTEAADLLGLAPGTAVSAAAIDVHAIVPGAGVASPSTLVMWMESGIHCSLNSRHERTVSGVVGAVDEGILPGYWGYEVGRASGGDVLDWLAKGAGQPQEALIEKAAALPPGAGGVMARDWRRGAELMEGAVGEVFAGVTPDTRPEQLYRALVEAMAFGLKETIEGMRRAGVFVRRFVAAGGLAVSNPLLMRIFSDVLDERMKLAESDRPAALGAAIHGALAAGASASGHASVSQTVHAMAHQRAEPSYRPDLNARKAYARLDPIFRGLTHGRGGGKWSL